MCLNFEDCFPHYRRKLNDKSDKLRRCLASLHCPKNNRNFHIKPSLSLVGASADMRPQKSDLCTCLSPAVLFEIRMSCWSSAVMFEIRMSCWSSAVMFEIRYVPHYGCQVIPKRKDIPGWVGGGGRAIHTIQYNAVQWCIISPFSALTFQLYFKITALMGVWQI